MKQIFFYYFKIDFQFASWGSPSQDLWFLIVTSLNEDDRDEKFDDIINHYYLHLKKSLEKLEYTKKIPNIHELYQDLWKHGAVGKILFEL